MTTTRPTTETPEREWPANRVWLPDGVIALAAVSPELENVEGDWWVRESADLARTDDAGRVADTAIQTTVQFLLNQIKHLAESFWSPDDAAEWLTKCDAYNAGQRLLRQLDPKGGK